MSGCRTCTRRAVGDQVVQPQDPSPEIDPELAEHLFGNVEPPAKPAIKLRVEVPRKEIKIGADIFRMVDDAVEAIAADPRIFSRVNELVTVIGSPPDAPRAALSKGTPIIRSIANPTLTERLTKFARFVAFKKKDWRDSRPPADVVGALLSRGDWSGVRPLLGVTESPILRPNGTIRQERGYDAETGHLYLPNADYLPIPERPTQDDAKRSLAMLEHVFCDFPHVDRAHKMVPIAAILTALARCALPGMVPAFLFDASTRGSGKTIQADIVHLVAFGRFASRKSYPEEDDELEKTLMAYALSGARCILFDNITRTFGGGPIDMCLTARENVGLRVLGQTLLLNVPWIAIILGSGNNLSMTEDMARRVLVSRLESPLENPEDRTDFVHDDLPAWVAAERPKLVAAALTILRAYFCVGCPPAGCPRWGSFEAWSRLVPHALVFAGGADVLNARPRGDAALTEDAAAIAVLLRRLPMLDPSGGGLTAKQIVAAAFPPHREDSDDTDGWGDVREAIEQLAPSRAGSKPSPRTLGEKLRRSVGRVMGDRKMVAPPAHGGVRRYRVAVVK
jgi:putative DNA primase/helicase